MERVRRDQKNPRRREGGTTVKLFPSKKKAAAREMIVLSLADIQYSPKPPTQKHLCKRKHKWVRSKYNRRCTRCGLEQEINNFVPMAIASRDMINFNGDIHLL